MDNWKNMKISYGDGVLGLAGNNFSYLFSYAKGALESLKAGGKEWLYRPLYPTFWRASTDNDRGNGFPYHSAAWLGADQFIKGQIVRLTVDGQDLTSLPQAPANNCFKGDEHAHLVEIEAHFQTATNPSCLVIVDYQVQADGRLRVRAEFRGQDGLPSLPVFGMRMIMPTPVKSFDYQGLSGETYPDRMAGAKPGQFHLSGMPLTPYLVPQEMGMHMESSRLLMKRDRTLNNADADRQAFKLLIEKDQGPFNFSLLPYTGEELENASHLEELPPVHRAVLVIAGAVRGVGGINSWGSDVAAPYRLPADRNYQTSLVINPNGVK